MTQGRVFNRDVFARLWADPKVPTQRIADAMGMTRQAVSWRARQMGLPSRANVRRRVIDPVLLRDMWLAGVRSADIAAYFGAAHHSCVCTAARNLGLPRRQKGGKSGFRNGGWQKNITLAEWQELRAARRMAETARAEQAALANAEMVDHLWTRRRAAA
jgi:hypothetical protein